MTVESLAEARALKENDSRLWTALDALKSVVRDIENGTEPMPEALAIHWYEPLPDGGKRHRFCVAGLRFPDHIALLEIGKQRCISDWLE